MFLRGGAQNAFIIIKGNGAGYPVSELMHPLQKDVLTHPQAKDHSEEPKPAFMGVEYCEV